MQDIIKEYGPALITVVAIIAIVAMIAAMFKGTDSDPSFVQGQFESLVGDFFEAAQERGELPKTNAGEDDH